MADTDKAYHHPELRISSKRLTFAQVLQPTHDLGSSQKIKPLHMSVHPNRHVWFLTGKSL